MRTPKSGGQKKPKIRHRYSVGEWYGVGIERLSIADRIQRAKTELEVDGLTSTPCPFQKEASCSKKFGFCSIRQYEQIGEASVRGAGPLITTCPNRFLEDETIFRWAGKEILDTSESIVLDQIGFLDRLRPASATGSDDEDEDGQDFIGRIDNVLVHPSREPMDWCALELQAVYFSGKTMKRELAMLAQSEEPLPFPEANHRPDWRSSGPKRLLPQLQTKVPTIRTWGKKMAVLVDEAFHASLVGLERERHLSNAEIVWFIVGYDPGPNGWVLRPRDVVFSRLDASVKALTGGVPLSKERFEEQLRIKLGRQYPGHPLANRG